MAAQRYSLHGLTFESELRLPGLPPGTGPADATIRRGDVPASLPEVRRRGVLYQAAPGRFRLAVDGIAAYLVSGGREIVVEPAPEADGEAVRRLLLGSPVAALLHQRQVLPLHASAVEIEGRCVAFGGLSGHGKSTLAAAFRQRGRRVLADDLLAVRTVPGDGPLAAPGAAELLLWPDVLEALGIDARGLSPVRRGSGKVRWPIAAGDGEPLPLARLYHLSPTPGSRLTLEPVAGMAKLEVLARLTYRRSFLEGLGGADAHFGLCTAVGSRVALRRVRWPDGAFRLAELVERIESDLPTGRSEGGGR